MSRPVPNSIASGQASWDADINDNTDLILGVPFPPHEVADETALNLIAPGSYDRCIAATITPPALWLSDGSAWIRLPSGSQSAMLDTSVSPVSGSGDDGTINTNFNNVAGKVNAIIAKLETAGLLLP